MHSFLALPTSWLARLANDLLLAEWQQARTRSPGWLVRACLLAPLLSVFSAIASVRSYSRSKRSKITFSINISTLFRIQFARKVRVCFWEKRIILLLKRGISKSLFFLFLTLAPHCQRPRSALLLLLLYLIANYNERHHVRTTVMMMMMMLSHIATSN